MKNIISYAAAARESFRVRPFTAVDSLIFSQLSYMRLDSIWNDPAFPAFISLEKLAEREESSALFADMVHANPTRRLLGVLAKNPRFRDTIVCFHTNRLDPARETQFSATTFLLEDETAYLAYRGTDLTFVGWKEDFNLAFLSPVPAQREAVVYLEAVAQDAPFPLRLGGHSKGGNLAVYAAIHAAPETADRVVSVFSHDAPGFRDNVFESEGYHRMKGRICATLPQSSQIGMLLHHLNDYSVIRSSNLWLFQHDPFSWEVDGADFRYVKQLTDGAVFMNRTVNAWIDSLDDAQRELFANTLYGIMTGTGAESLADLTMDWQKRSAGYVSAIKEIDEETRTMLHQILLSLFRMGWSNLRRDRYEKQE